MGIVSLAQNLVPTPTNGFAVFRADVPTGEVVLMSANRRGHPADQSSDQAAMSADGLSMAFRTAATNLVRRDTHGQSHVYLTRQP